ncbi:MAG: preprotein translocase subunit TatC [Gammaproteobacteria bacterium SG8_11]|nr:MAG: preprotein translocase subunit TatC [Gammaproteobacteria bacterium SG8_11]
MSKPNDFPPQDQTFVSHLVELRDRLLRAVLAVLVIFLCLFAFANDLYTFLAEPLLRYMPEGTSMIATEVASPFLTPFKLTLVLSVFVAMPVILYQLWAFVAPGLYQNEKRLVMPLLLSSTILFYLGMAFAYYVVFPLVFKFLTGVAPEGVAVMTDISRYLDFVLKLFFAFGVAFEVPIATILVIWAGITTAESLAAKRPYIIVAAFVVGMLLTPPDVISQTLLALPMWLLFELGLVMSKLYTKKPKEEESAEKPEQETVDNPSNAESATQAAATTAPASAATAATATTTDANTATTDNFDEEYRPLSEAEMDEELDRIEADETQEANQVSEEADSSHDGEPHPEFEPISEEEAHRLDHPDHTASDNHDQDKPAKD